jgi:S1-C subfamily serine protease
MMMRAVMVALCLAWAWLLPAATAGAQDAQAMIKARASVVSVLPVWPGRPPNAAEPEGSGVVVGDGTRVVTADHVLGPGEAAARVMVRDSDGVIHRARVLARNRLTDIAVLALDTPLTAATWRSGPVGPGLPVCAIGNAFGLGLSITCGRVSATHRAGTGFNGVEDFIQTDAAVNPGMSGGALVDEDGALVGMLSAIFTKQSDANIGVNFAVHLGLVHAVRSAAEAGAPFVPFKTGVLARPVPPKGEAGREGLLVARLVDGSAGVQAGLETGDVIYSAGGRRIRKVADWVSVMAQVGPGDEVSVSGIRGVNPFEATLKRAQ